MNTVENKSHEWGVSPWYWYFAMAIPKSVTIAYPLAIFAIFYKPKASFIDWGIVEILSPAVIFVGLYSFLPHKELRFIFPALTVFNLAGAMGMAKIFKKMSTSKTFNFILFTGVLVAL
jgi:alpha-1,6-mannosyltransferase